MRIGFPLLTSGDEVIMFDRMMESLSCYGGGIGGTQRSASPFSHSHHVIVQYTKLIQAMHLNGHITQLSPDRVRMGSERIQSGIEYIRTELFQRHNTRPHAARKTTPLNATYATYAGKQDILTLCKHSITCNVRHSCMLLTSPRVRLSRSGLLFLFLLS